MLGSSSCLMSSMGFRSEKWLLRRDAAPIVPADSKAGSGCGQHLGLGGAAPGNPQAGADRLLDTVRTVGGHGELRGAVLDKEGKPEAENSRSCRVVLFGEQILQ